MLSKLAIFAAAVVLSCAGLAVRAEAASKTVPAALTITNVTAPGSSYSGSQCESNTYSGQCPSGTCECIVVSGNVCSGRIGPKSRKDQTCSLFMTIDEGLQTGSVDGVAGCSPIFAVLQGFVFSQTEAFLVGTICPNPTKPATFSGGWVLDAGAGFSAGAGTFTGTINNTLSLKMKGTFTQE